jgi:kynurenine formamidase
MRKLAVLLILAAPLAAQNLSKLVDLTHDLDEKTVYWPTGKPFVYQRESWGASPGGYWYASGSFAASEHLGTHIDSPIHFAKGQATTDQIALTKLVAPALVIDIARQCAKTRDYLLSAADVKRWEQSNGAVPAGAIVLVRTGWSRFWPDRKQYMGSDKDGDTANLHFPGIGKDAAALFAERKVAGVGIDTASIDHGPSKDFTTHQVLNGAGIYALENVANLDKLPVKGATLIALPMKIKGGSGGPVRILAALP